MITDKTIKSKNQPKQTNVTWVDLSGKTPVEKHFINGKWREMSGGGGSNSDYSSTKQTVTLFNDTVEMLEDEGIYGYEVLNPDFDLVAGETYTVVFDGVSYNIEATGGETPLGSIVALGEFNGNNGPSFETYPFNIVYRVIKGEQTLVLTSGTEGPHTFVIKQEETVTTTTPEFKDAVDSVTGYSIDKGNETLYDGTVETGSDGDYFSGVITPPITPVEGDTYKVTFNGTEYICKCFNDGGYLTIGAQFAGETYDWSTYPFNIEKNSLNVGAETLFNTNQEGSCTLKIEHFGTISKTTPEFVSMIQGIGGGGTSGCQIIYPDSISWVDTLYSQYNKEPEAGNIYFIPYVDTSDRQYLYPVYINELTNSNNIMFSGGAMIIGTPIITVNETLTVLDFSGVINPSSSLMSGLKITYSHNAYRLSYKAGSPVS